MKRGIFVFALIIIVVLPVIVVALRPSYTDFKHFADEPSTEWHKVVLTKTSSNLFSTYFEKRYYTVGMRGYVSLKQTVRYRGFLNNFTEIK